MKFILASTVLVVSLFAGGAQAACPEGASKVLIANIAAVKSLSNALVRTHTLATQQVLIVRLNAIQDQNDFIINNCFGK